MSEAQATSSQTPMPGGLPPVIPLRVPSLRRRLLKRYAAQVTWGRRNWPIILLLLGALLVRILDVTQPLAGPFAAAEARVAMVADQFLRFDASLLHPALATTGREFDGQLIGVQLYPWLVALLYRVFGQHEALGRLLSIVAGLAGMLALYRLAYRVADKPSALIAAAIWGFLPVAVVVDRAFLPASMIAAMLAAAAWALVVYLQSDRTPPLVAAAALLAVALLMHPASVVAIPPMLYAAIAILRRRGRLTWRGGLPAGLAILGPVIAAGVYYPLVLLRQAPDALDRRQFVDDLLIGGGMRAWLDKGFYFEAAVAHVRWFAWLWPVALLVIAGLLLPPTLRRRRLSVDEADWDPGIPEQIYDQMSVKARWFFHWWAGAALALFLFAGAGLVDSPWALHWASIAAAGLAANAIFFAGSWLEIDERFFGSAMITVGALALTFWEQGSLARTAAPPAAMQSVAVGRALADLAGPADLVAVAGHEIGNPVGLYYSHRRGWLLPPDREPALWKRPAMLPDDQRLIAVLAALRQRGVTWLAIARSARDAGGARLLADRPRFIQHLERTWTRIAESESYVIYRAHDDADVHN